MKTFKDYLNESKDETFDIQSLLNESHDLTEEQEAMIDSTVDRILEAHKEGKNLEDCVEEIVNEGLLGSIFGGLTGVGPTEYYITQNIRYSERCFI